MTEPRISQREQKAQLAIIEVRLRSRDPVLLKGITRHVTHTVARSARAGLNFNEWRRDNGIPIQGVSNMLHVVDRRSARTLCGTLPSRIPEPWEEPVGAPLCLKCLRSLRVDVYGLT